jgi:hypothetical protein
MMFPFAKFDQASGGASLSLPVSFPGPSNSALSAAEDLICFRTRQYSETATDTTSTRLTARIRNHQSIRTTH